MASNFVSVRLRLVLTVDDAHIMKFGRYLKENAAVVEEWRREYINYRALKKAIHAAVDELEQEDDQLPPVPSSPTSISPVLLPVDPEWTGNETDDTRIDDARHDELERGEEADVEDNDTPTKVKLSRSTRVPSVATSFASPSKPSTIRTPRTRRNSAWSLSGDVRPRIYRYPADLPFQQLVELLPPQSHKLFQLLDAELAKVSNFFGLREAEAVARFNEIVSNLAALEDHKKEYRHAHDHPSAGIANADRFVSALRFRSNAASASTAPASATLGQAAVNRGRTDNYSAAKSSLKLASK